MATTTFSKICDLHWELPIFCLVIVRTTRTREKALATRVDSAFAAFARVGPSEFMVLKPVLKSNFADLSQLKIIAEANVSSSRNFLSGFQLSSLSVMNETSETRGGDGHTGKKRGSIEIVTAISNMSSLLANLLARHFSRLRQSHLRTCSGLLLTN